MDYESLNLHIFFENKGFYMSVRAKCSANKPKPTYKIAKILFLFVGKSLMAFKKS